jgi:transcriptional regulator
MPYNPPHDRVTDPAILADFIRSHPFGALVTGAGAALDADFLPFLVESADGGVRLIAHCALANPLTESVHDGDEVLVLFGPVEHYVSPTWYASKAEHHRAVPTWNYMTAHVGGRISLHRDESWLRAAVARLTNAMEGRQSERTGEKPWRVGQAPKEYVDELLANIVGVSIEATRMEGRFKVSANKSEADTHGAAEGIARSGAQGGGRGAAELAARMRRS